MATAHRTKEFLSVIDEKTKGEVLQNIADHYGITVEAAFEEVTGDEAHHLLDYMREPTRSATSALMQRHGMRGW